MKKVIVGFCGFVLMWGTAGASIIPLTLSDLGTLQAVEGWDVMTTTMYVTNPNLRGVVTSRPYKDINSNWYYYFYQVNNTGLSNWNRIEVFSIWPFQGADDNTQMGYLTDGQTSDFVPGTEIPAGASVDTDTQDGSTISFGFPGYINPIKPGEISKVLYVKSKLPPQIARGNIIDGTIANGTVIAAVPEPVTVLFMALSCGVFIFRRKNK